MTLSSLFIVCSHGRRSAHVIRHQHAGCVEGCMEETMCPGGRPATLKDLEALGDVVHFDNGPEGVMRAIVIPLPQMVAE